MSLKHILKCIGQCHEFVLLLVFSGIPANDGGSAVTDYIVQMVSPDNTTREVYKGRDTECVVAGLLPGRPYLFQVRCANKIGVSLLLFVF